MQNIVMKISSHRIIEKKQTCFAISEIMHFCNQLNHQAWGCSEPAQLAAEVLAGASRIQGRGIWEFNPGYISLTLAVEKLSPTSYVFG